MKSDGINTKRIMKMTVDPKATSKKPAYSTVLIPLPWWCNANGGYQWRSFIASHLVLVSVSHHRNEYLCTITLLMME